MRFAKTSGGPNDDRRVALFRGGRRVATAGDLRDPVSFIRSERVPDDEASFINTFTPYYNTFAASNLGKRRPLGGHNSDSAVIHYFFIRNCPEAKQISENDYLVFENEVYGIRTVEPLGTKRDFLQVGCIDWMTLTADMRQAAAIEVAPSQEITSPSTDRTEFWDQLKEDRK